ncbi:Leucine-rich repeat [Sesbania bispinosa]|nr:Leucine-rich repeat [Sesbania bispinosa]
MDKDALLKLKDGFIHGRHILSSWKGDDCCKWKGISCNNLTGRVTTLDLQRSYYITTQLGDSEDVFLNDKAILAWKGANREYGKILGLMTTIDLSCNHLTGEIPQSITKLVALAGLNLSTNNLTGLIPANIGHMELLESLDLSRNHLYGRMPSSFSNLSFLSYMNLSFNNLSGKIPLSSQIQSFDASTFVGNSGLCGPPLINHCPGDMISPVGRPDKHDTIEDEDKLMTFGFFVSLGLGFCVGFWGVCGTLVIKTSWRYAYFQFCNNMNDWMHVTLAVFLARMKRRFRVQD